MEHVRLAVVLGLSAGLFAAEAQAGLPAIETQGSSAAAKFHLALPGYQYRFPRDHGSHDDFRTEWWYYTGHLVSVEGRRFGYELTFFRRGIREGHSRPNPSRWAVRHLYFAHFALTEVDEGRFRYTEKLSRAGLGKAGAEAGGLHVWIDRWIAESDPSDGNGHHLKASAEQFAIDLFLRPEKPPVIHGRGGISRKGNATGQASHYYSMTRLATKGTLMIDGRERTVTGLSWMDHEFGSAELGEDLVGWDWFSVQLKDRGELMLYLLRRSDGSLAPASSGTFVFADGRTRHLSHVELRVEVLDHWVSQASGARYPSHWRISVAPLDLTLELRPLLADQELITNKSTRVTYWEGAVTVAGTRDGADVTGQGYVELTGYAKPFTQGL